MPNPPEPPLRETPPRPTPAERGSLIPHHHPLSPQHARPSQPRRLPGILSTIWLLFMAAAIGLGITFLGFRSYEVEGASMETTLMNTDRVIIDKLPRTLARLTKHPYVPPRGEIIIFSQFGFFDNSGPGNKQLIKRVVALPGERVEIKNGKLTVFNSDQPSGFEPDKSGLYPFKDQATPGNVSLTVPASSVFVIGDNRANSTDSRTFGAIKAEQIVGRLSIRFWPIDQAKHF